MEFSSARTSGSTWGIVVGVGSGIFGLCMFKPQWNKRPIFSYVSVSS